MCTLHAYELTCLCCYICIASVVYTSVVMLGVMWLVVILCVLRLFGCCFLDCVYVRVIGLSCVRERDLL